MKETEQASNCSFSEEVTPNAIYNIKKNDKDEIIQKILKFATLEKIVDYLCYEISDVTLSDSNFMVVLFATYPSFTTSAILFDMIVERYSNSVQSTDPENQKHSKHIYNIIVYWLQKSSSEIIARNIFDLENPIFLKFFKLLSPILKENIRRRLDEMSKNKSVRKLSGTISINSSFGEGKEFDDDDKSVKDCILDFNPELIAEQLTIRDAQLLKRLNPCDCLGSIWGNRHKNPEQFKTTVRPTIENFNLICYLVQTTILTARPTTKLKNLEKARAAIIEHWIIVCRYLRTLKNFSSLKAIISALSSSSIYSLTKTYTRVSKNLQTELELYQNLMSDDYNNQAVRDVLKIEGSSKVAVLDNSHRKSRTASTKIKAAGTIPYLGTFLSDLIKIDLASPSYNSDGLINLDKKRKEFEVLCQLILYKSSVGSYSLNINNCFLLWLSGLKVLTEQECQNLSKIVERTARVSAAHSKKEINECPKKSNAIKTDSVIGSVDSVILENLEHSSSLNSVENISSCPPPPPLPPRKKQLQIAPILPPLVAKVSVLYNKLFSDIQFVELNDSLTCQNFINLTLACNGIIATNYENIAYQFIDNTFIEILPDSIVLSAVKKADDINIIVYCISLSNIPNKSKHISSPPSSKYKKLLKKVFLT